MRPFGPFSVAAEVQVHEPSAFMQKCLMNSSMHIALQPPCPGTSNLISRFFCAFAWMDIQYYTLCASPWRDLVSRKLFCFCTALSTNYRHAVHRDRKSTRLNSSHLGI